jgi:uracil-DNA glycosylase family protein
MMITSYGIMAGDPGQTKIGRRVKAGGAVHSDGCCSGGRAPPMKMPLADLAAEAAVCRRCDLYRHATQTVFGEGPPTARLILVGEQPGDQEDLADRPFVGPAGHMLDRALKEAGIARETVYVTNAVKHFKFEPRGKRRIHANPNRAEIDACRFWLDQERDLIKPAVIILLGASAARAVLGRAVTISRERGRAIALGNSSAMVTMHPAYLLRLRDETSRQREYAALVADLRLAHSWLDESVATHQQSKRTPGHHA